MIDPFEKGKQIRRGELDDEIPNYDELTGWQQRYPKVHWITAGTRAQAERLAFRVLERFWEDHVK